MGRFASIEFGPVGLYQSNMRSLVPALLIGAALFGCSRVDLPLGVTIRSPSDGATLVAGQSFRIVADSDIDQPPDQVTVFEVGLVSRSAGYQANWQVDRVFGTDPRILDDSFVVPLDAPAEADYTLMVSVLLPNPESDSPRFAFRDSIKVRVTAGP